MKGVKVGALTVTAAHKHYKYKIHTYTLKIMRARWCEGNIFQHAHRQATRMEVTFAEGIDSFY